MSESHDNIGIPLPVAFSDRRATLRDVARLAGVSVKTASRVANAEPNVSKTTRESVQRAIAHLGFRPHAGAGSLRRRSTASIGLVVEDITDRFQAIIASAVGEVATQNRAVVLVATSRREIEQERKVVVELSTRRVDGLILIPAVGDHGYLHAELRAGLRVVAVDRPIDGVSVPTFVSDNHGATERATEHLIAAGHSRIGIVTDELTIWTARERVAGYRSALARNGLDADTALVACPGTDPVAVAHAYDGLAKSASPPTAIITGNSHITTGLLVHLSTMPAGHYFPAIVGIDDHELFAAFTPGITVMVQRAHSLGAAAAMHLFARRGSSAEPTRRKFDMQLIERGSGEVAP